MPQTFLAIFDHPEKAKTAIDLIKQAGIELDNLEVLSPQPYARGQFLPEKSKSHIGLFALMGASLGGLGGVLLATLTALAFPIPTGGMPIVSWWPVGIVTYEATMLGAILSTLLGLLVELRLPNLKTLSYDEAVADGGVLLVVRCADPGKLRVVEKIISDVGAKKTKML